MPKQDGTGAVPWRSVRTQVRDGCRALSWTMCLYIVAQFLCWTVHDGVQEWMFKQEGFTFGSFMAFCLQSCCVVGSGLELLILKDSSAVKPLKASSGDLGEGRVRVKTAEEEEEDWTRRPWKEVFLSVPAHYAYLGLMIALSSSLANRALNFVSQPVKVLFKSSKLVPVMTFRALMGNVASNSWKEYTYAILVCGGLTIFTMADHKGSREVKAQLVGLVMLLLSICADAVAPNLQEKLMRKFKQPKASLMLHSNWVSAAMTLMFILPSGEGYRAVMYLKERPFAAKMLFTQSLAGCLGVAAYVGCIQYAGSKTTVLVTSTRKMFTIALSFLLISQKTFTAIHLTGLALAIGGIFGSGLEEADSKGKSVPPTVPVPPSSDSPRLPTLAPAASAMYEGLGWSTDSRGGGLGDTDDGALPGRVADGGGGQPWRSGSGDTTGTWGQNGSDWGDDKYASARGLESRM